MDTRGVWAPKKAKKSWDAKQSRSPPVLTGLYWMQKLVTKLNHNK